MALGQSDIGLLMRIRGDSKEAVKAVKDVRTETDDLTKSTNATGVSLNALGAAAGAIAVVGLAALGAAAIATTKQLFDLARTTADYGSEIFDAQQRTGLTARTMSALRHEADQAGVSFKTITDFVSKFSVLIGQANQGNEKAIETLTRYGIDPVEAARDLDAAFAKAIKTISEMESPTQRAAAAQQLFKDRTGELNQLLADFDGDLPALISKLEKMGLVMSDEDAAAADQLNDALTLVDQQMAGLGRTIGVALIPLITELTATISRNQEQIQTAVEQGTRNVSDTLSGLVEAIRRLDIETQATTNSSLATWAVWAIEMERTLDPVARIAYEVGKALRSIAPVRGALGGGIGPDASLSIPTVTPRVARAGRTPRDTSAADAARRALKAEQAYLADIKAIYSEETEFFTAERKKMLGVATARADEQGISADKLAEFEEELETQVLEFRRAKLEEYLESLKKSNLDVRAETRAAVQDLKITELDIEALRVKHDRNERDRRNKRLDDEKAAHKERLKSWNQMLDDMKRRQKEFDDEADRSARERLQLTRERIEAGGTLSDPLAAGIFGSLGVDPVSIFGDQAVILSQAEFLKDVWADVSLSIGASIGHLIDGLAQMTAAWLATGKFSAKAALQMASGVALGLALQAGVKALFELAEGWAAAAQVWWNPAMAAVAKMHFTAAVLYGKVAGVAAGVGVVTGLGARAFGDQTGRATGGAQGNTSAAPRTNFGDQRTLSLSSQTGSGVMAEIFRRNNALIERQTLVLGELEKTTQEFGGRIEGISPTDIIRAGAGGASKEIRGAVEEEFRNDGRATEEMLRSQGVYN